MLRLCLKPPTWSLLPGLSLLQSILHSTATIFYLKTVSIPGPFLFLRPSHWPHVAYKVPSQPAEGASSALELVPNSLSRAMPTMPHHTQGSNNLPAVPPTSRLLPTVTHAPLSARKLHFSWEWKHAQHTKGGTVPPRSFSEQLSWDLRPILLLCAISPHSPSVSSAIKVHRTHKRKHINAGKCNSRWWVKRNSHLFMGFFFFMRFHLPCQAGNLLLQLYISGAARVTSGCQWREGK